MRTASVLLLAFTFWTASRAQTPGGSLVGRVTDQAGGSIENAQVTLANQETGRERKGATNGDGVFAFPALPASEYVLKVARAGFALAERRDVVLQVGAELRLDVQLATGDRVDSITVRDEAVPLSSQSSNFATVIPTRNIQDLPLNGRQLQNLALLAPGVLAGWNLSTAANRYGKARENLEGAFVVNGARGRSNHFVLDGVPINVRQYGVINFEPSVEAVREFEVKTSAAPAEFGRSMGSTVNLVTRSGTSQFHASLYEFFRNDRFDANDTFNKRAGLRRGKLRQNQFGGTVGGPLYGNRHFFFGSFEELRIIEGVETRITSVPTAVEARGSIAYRDASGVQQTADLGNRITPLSARLLALYPAPNAPGTGPFNYNSALTIALNDHQFHARTDHFLTSKDTVNVRVSWNLNDQDYVVNRFGGPFLPGFNLPNPERTTNAGVAWSRSIGSTVLHEARLGYNRYANDLGNGDQSSGTEIGLPNGSSVNGIPSITFAAGTLERLGGQPWFNREQNEDTYFASDSLSLLRGRHSIKLGAELSRLHFNTRGAGNQRGTVTFDGSRNGIIPRTGNERAAVLADLLLGLPQQASITVGEFGRGYRQTIWAGFAQDSWRVTPSLTLNYGLRYDYAAPWTEVNGKLSNFIPRQGLVANLDQLYEPDRNNIAPRAGFAYDVGGRGTTLVRGGFSLLYETALQANSVQLIENNPPYAASALTRSPEPFAAGDAPATTLTSLLMQAAPSRAISAVAREDFRNPYTMQFSFGVQRSLGGLWVGELAYAGSRGVKLPIVYNLNQVPLENLGAADRSRLSAAVAAGSDTTPLLQTLRPYPEFDSIGYSSNAAASTYHSLQVRLERRFSEGLTLLASYTWSKSIDNASDFSSGDASEQVLNAYDLGRQRAVSSFDVPHRFVGAANYALPFGSGPGSWLGGWQVNGIVTAQTGQPFTPFLSVNDPYRNETFNRPNVSGDPEANVPSGLAFNPAVFSVPAAGAFGNAGRNIVRGDGFFSVDLSLFRTVRLTERLSIQLRAEAVNALNQVNYQGPVTNLSAAPGQWIAAAPPRIVQLGAKLVF